VQVFHSFTFYLLIDVIIGKERQSLKQKYLSISHEVVVEGRRVQRRRHGVYVYTLGRFSRYLLKTFYFLLGKQMRGSMKLHLACVSFSFRRERPNGDEEES
jgi:hypothetical protein